MSLASWRPSPGLQHKPHLISHTSFNWLTQGYLSNYVQVGTVMLMRRSEWRLPSSSPDEVPTGGEPVTKAAGFCPPRWGHVAALTCDVLF